MTSTREVCAKMRGPPLRVRPFFCSFSTSSNDVGKKYIDGSSLFNLPAKRLRRTVHNLHRHTIFFLEHAARYLGMPPSNYGPPQPSGFQPEQALRSQRHL